MRARPYPTPLDNYGHEISARASSESRCARIFLGVRPLLDLRER